MPRVLIAGHIHPCGVAMLREAPGFEVDYVEAIATPAYAPRVGDADAILIRTQPMPAAVIEQAKRLKIVSRHGVGYDSVDLSALNARKIPLTIVGDVNSRPVAEHAMLLILAVAKRLHAYDACVRQGDWDYRNSFAAGEVHGKSLLIVGFGRIGRLVATMAAGFGMQITAYDPHLSAAAIEAAGIGAAPDLRAALAQADFVTVHMPKGPTAAIGAADLAVMKPTAVMINTARGGIVDEAALTAALATDRIGGAGLDVFEQEPPDPGNPLLGSEKAILTPHSASLTAECAARMSHMAAANILDFFAGRLDPALVVNAKEAGLAAGPA